jgi:predicted nucleotidyltransferase
MDDQPLRALIRDFSELNEVEAIALAGSHSMQMNDALSDYDLYIYTSTEIPLTARQAITARHCRYMELNNQFWETEDDGELISGTEIELIYRNLDWLDEELERVVIQHQASTGYTTCFWTNLRNSQILYDEKQRLTQLQQKYTRPYSDELSLAIINKNLPLLTDAMPAYPRQIAKALKRGDHISVHHRVTEYLASYFDVLFALNKVAHPGEKRLINYATTLCDKLPDEFESNINQLLTLTGQSSPELTSLITRSSGNLVKLVDSHLVEKPD